MGFSVFKDADGKDTGRLHTESRSMRFPWQVKGANPEEMRSHGFLPQPSVPLFMAETRVLSRCGHIGDTLLGLHPLMLALASSEIFEMPGWHKLLTATTDFLKILIFIEISHYTLQVILSVFFS